MSLTKVEFEATEPDVVSMKLTTLCGATASIHLRGDDLVRFGNDFVAACLAAAKLFAEANDETVLASQIEALGKTKH